MTGGRRPPRLVQKDRRQKTAIGSQGCQKRVCATHEQYRLIAHAMPVCSQQRTEASPHNQRSKHSREGQRSFMRALHADCGSRDMILGVCPSSSSSRLYCTCTVSPIFNCWN
eukprot:scaffold27486_cov31-Tisochrysis_lutea.AAC.5